MVFNVIALLILLYSFINLKKGFVLYLMFQIVGLTSTVFLKFGSVNITIGMFMDLFYLLAYCCKHNRFKSIVFPWRRPFFVILFSWILTCFFSVAGFVGEFTRACSNLLQDIVFIWLIWKMIDTRKDLLLLIKGMTVTFFVTSLYGLYEYIAKTNPIVNYKSTLVDGGITLYANTVEAAARGYRMISFMEHPIGAGMTFALFVTFVLVSNLCYREKYTKNYKIFTVFVLVLCILCVILSKMRSPLVFLFIATLGVVDFRKIKFYKLLLICLVGTVAIMPFMGNYINIFLGIFSEKASTKIGGSSIEQRLSQLSAVWHLMLMSPIGGLGEKFKNFISNQYTRAALSYESVWFEQMVKHGIVGVIANVYLAYYTVIKIPRIYKSRQAFFLGLAYWITYSLTSIPAFRVSLFYLLLFYFIKKSDVYKEELVKANNKTRVFGTVKFKIE